MPAAWNWVAELLTGEETRRNSRACVERGARNTGFNASWSLGDALSSVCGGRKAVVWQGRGGTAVAQRHGEAVRRGGGGWG